MKRTLIFVLFALLLTACVSNERKALRQIDKFMFQTAKDYDSYQPVETVIMRPDTIHSYYYNPQVRLLAQKAFTRSTDWFNAKKELVSIHIPAIPGTGAVDYNSFSTGFGRVSDDMPKRYQDYLEIYRKHHPEEQRNRKAVIERRKIVAEEIRSKEAEVAEFERNYALTIDSLNAALSTADLSRTWAVNHKFRIKNGFGGYDLNLYTFIFDAKFSEILDYADSEESIDDGEQKRRLLRQIDKAMRSDRVPDASDQVAWIGDIEKRLRQLTTY